MHACAYIHMHSSVYACMYFIYTYKMASHTGYGSYSLIHIYVYIQGHIPYPLGGNLVD